MTLSFADSKQQIFDVTVTLEYGSANKAACPAICSDEPHTLTLMWLVWFRTPLLLRHGEPSVCHAGKEMTNIFRY